MCLRRILRSRRAAALLAPAAACALSSVAVAAGPEPRAGTPFHVTLRATLTKDWSYVARGERDGCPVTTRVRGHREVALRSTKPSLVRVSFPRGRTVYSSGVVRLLEARASQSGFVVTDEAQPPSCTAHSVRRTDCLRPRRTRAGVKARFYRSRRNEISFARAPEFVRLPTTCPPEPAPVREERPSLDLAEGEISEAELRDPGTFAQTATGTAVERTSFSNDEDGIVVVRVSWHLTFRRLR